MSDIATVQRMISDAIRLRDSGQRDEAIAAFLAIITQFGKSTDPPVREKVAEALLNLGSSNTLLWCQRLGRSVGRFH